MLASGADQGGEEEALPVKAGQRWERTIAQEQEDTLESSREATRQRTQEAQAAIRGNVAAYARREGYTSSLESDRRTPAREGGTELYELEAAEPSEKPDVTVQELDATSDRGKRGSSASPQSRAQDHRRESIANDQTAVIRRLEAELVHTRDEYDRLQMRYEDQVTKVRSLEEEIRKLEQEHTDATEGEDFTIEHSRLHGALQRCQSQRDKAQQERDACLDRERDIRQALRAVEADLHQKERETCALEADARTREERTLRALETLTHKALQTTAYQTKVIQDPPCRCSRQPRRERDEDGLEGASSGNRTSARRKHRGPAEVKKEKGDKRLATAKRRLGDNTVIASTREGDLRYVRTAGLRKWI